jgi:large subunit ribosomal protein L7/L12
VDTHRIADELSNLNALQLVELTKTLEDKWGVKASPALPPSLEPEDDLIPGFLPEPTELSVVLSEVGPNRLNVIRAVRDLTGYGLKEAKDLVDNLPKTLTAAPLPKADAEAARKRLEEAGAKVDLVTP